jgi:hypothetical protein
MRDSLVADLLGDSNLTGWYIFSSDLIFLSLDRDLDLVLDRDLDRDLDLVLDRDLDLVLWRSSGLDGIWEEDLASSFSLSCDFNLELDFMTDLDVVFFFLGAVDCCSISLFGLIKIKLTGSNLIGCIYSKTSFIFIYDDPI